MTPPNPPPAPAQKKPQQQAKHERLSKALKANLKRRKQLKQAGDDAR